MTESEPYNVSDLEHERSSDFKQIYSNNASMGLSFFDVSITFGELVPSLHKVAPKIQDRVTVTMSWEHLKALYEALSKIIAGYEQSQGAKIRTPTQLVPISTPKELPSA
jgi:hypothetical protein